MGLLKKIFKKKKGDPAVVPAAAPAPAKKAAAAHGTFNVLFRFSLA